MLNRISESLDKLSAAERKVGECALADPKWFVHAAVADIAAPACPSCTNSSTKATTWPP